MPAHGEVVPDVSGSTLTDGILLYAPYMCQGVLTFIICTIVTYIPAEGAFRSSGLSYILFITVAEIIGGITDTADLAGGNRATRTRLG